eukprot:m.151573 g.151573  ORF g.151573 m.151573 type:complete len:771 (+) comp15040_c0_seq9:89-2401(+)
MENYKTLRVIGEGAFGKAMLVERKDDRKKYVIKLVEMKKMRPKEKEEARKECEVLKEMRHPNIISFCESFEKGAQLCIVMDYADGGDLSNKLASQRGRLLPEVQALDWFVQICLALKHVHDRKILHRDLKTQNIFLTSRNMIKLGDFGISKVLKNTRELARTQIGTPYYFSPELCNGKPYNNKSDIWALGVILYELLMLKYPFDGRNINQLVLKICNGSFRPVHPQYSRDLRQLVDTMLSLKQARRPSVNAILRKSFIQSRIAQFLSETVLQEEFSHTVLHGKKGKEQDRKPMLPPLGRKPIPPAPPAEKPPVPPSAPQAQSRGPCGICGEQVMTDQERTQDAHGVYYHIPCIETDNKRRRREEQIRENSAKEEARQQQMAKENEREEMLREENKRKELEIYQQKLKNQHKEFLERRKAGLENKKRILAAMRGPDCENYVAPKESQPSLDKEKKITPAVSQDAAVAEFQERQRQARANRARIEESMRGDSGEPADASMSSGETVQAMKRKREKKSSAQKHAVEDIDLGKTRVVSKPSGLAVPSAAKVAKKKAPKGSSALRDMIKKHKADAKKRDKKFDPLDVEIIPSEPKSSKPEEPLVPTEDELAKSVRIALNEQVDIDLVDSEETATAEGISLQMEEASIKEEFSNADNEYEKLLVNLSVVCADVTEESKIDDTGNEDSASDFGDEESGVGESVFAKMERIRNEMEQKLGFDTFVSAYKRLREIFESDDMAVDIPTGIADSIKETLGEHSESYFNILELVKAENGVFT